PASRTKLTCGAAPPAALAVAFAIPRRPHAHAPDARRRASLPAHRQEHNGSPGAQVHARPEDRGGDAARAEGAAGVTATPRNSPGRSACPPSVTGASAGAWQPDTTNTPTSAAVSH